MTPVSRARLVQRAGNKKAMAYKKKEEGRKEGNKTKAPFCVLICRAEVEPRSIIAAVNAAERGNVTLMGFNEYLALLNPPRDRTPVLRRSLLELDSDHCACTVH